jgi:phosphate starvation-inducible PhoH-like protein
LGRRNSNYEKKQQKYSRSETRREEEPLLGSINQTKSDAIRMGYFEPIRGSEIKIHKLIEPKTQGQAEVLHNLRSELPMSVIIGPAGSGKTFLSVLTALEFLRDERIERVIITRPAVESDEQLGFLPGGVDSKMLPYVLPILDCFVTLVGGRMTNHLIEKGVIQIRPFAFMRGSTFSDAFVLADEMSNSTISQMKCLTTRAGENSKTVILGDPNQSDLKASENGLVDLRNRLAKSRTKLISVDQLDERDVVRSRVVSDVLAMYNEPIAHPSLSIISR